MGIIYTKGVDNGVPYLGHMIRELLNPWLAKGAVLSGAWTISKGVGNGYLSRTYDKEISILGQAGWHSVVHGHNLL